MKDSSATLRSEANAWGHYYLGRQPSEHAVTTYCRLVVYGTNQQLDSTERTLLDFARRHPRMIGLLDSGLLTVRPQAELRRRLYVMFSILETDLENYDHFSSKNRSPFYLLYVAWVGMRGIFQRVAGYVLVRALL